jgi:predicted nucleic acid-binding protein
VSHSAVVLDASVTATWLLPDEASPASRAVFVRIRRGSLVPHAPDLWLWECGNIIANGVKRHRITPADALLTWSVLDAIRTRVELTNPAPAQTRAALTLAIDDGLSLYDAAYLWLAMSLKLPLLSTDQALAQAAVRRGVTVVGPGEVA